MENKYIRYYELFTEDGPLYIYEEYKEDPNKSFNNEIPEIYEFFTQEAGKRGYEDISFLNGQAVFKREEKNREGITTAWYTRLLTASEFLERVLPYLDSEESMAKKAKDVMQILEAKANNTTLGRIVVTPMKPTEEQKNKVARKVLKEYLK